ncbi:Thymidylate kinase [Amycolatopsis sp. CA-230715]|nr:Thymidylate kinase [Amycolatopsis sp. CA-230715]
MARGENVHVTAEPSDDPIGKLASELTETVTGHALACLYAADRYHHAETNILPRLKTGHIVISDRYLTSSLVSQLFGGVDPIFLWQLNEEAERPDLTVILETSAPGSTPTEAEHYRRAADWLVEAGFDVLRIDCDKHSPEQSAALIRDQLTTGDLSDADA